MISRKNRFDDWTRGFSRNDSIEVDNVGRKMLEKMGWASGLGLGKDNQGMIENPMWKYRRDALCKTGFKSKEEMVVGEILTHQKEFEDLLGELNECCKDQVESARPSWSVPDEKVRTSKRKVRYVKMAHAKDIRNYSIKDFKGIIGKEVTKKNLDLLSGDGNNCDSIIFKETVTNNISQMPISSSELNNAKHSRVTIAAHSCQKPENLKENKNALKRSSLSITPEELIVQQDQKRSQKKTKHMIPESNGIDDSKDSFNLAQQCETKSSLNSDSVETAHNKNNCTTEHTVKSENIEKKIKRKKEKKKEECGEERRFEEVWAQISEAFDGSNLISIKGYGNW